MHGRIRTFCESICFYNGEDKEREDCQKLYEDVYKAQRAYVRSQVPLRTFTFMCIYIVSTSTLWACSVR